MLITTTPRPDNPSRLHRLPHSSRKAGGERIALGDLSRYGGPLRGAGRMNRTATEEAAAKQGDYQPRAQNSKEMPGRIRHGKKRTLVIKKATDDCRKGVDSRHHIEHELEQMCQFRACPSGSVHRLVGQNHPFDWIHQVLGHFGQQHQAELKHGERNQEKTEYSGRHADTYQHKTQYRGHKAKKGYQAVHGVVVAAHVSHFPPLAKRAKEVNEASTAWVRSALPEHRRKRLAAKDPATGDARIFIGASFQ